MRIYSLFTFSSRVTTLDNDGYCTLKLNILFRLSILSTFFLSIQIKMPYISLSKNGNCYNLNLKCFVRRTIGLYTFFIKVVYQEQNYVFQLCQKIKNFPMLRHVYFLLLFGKLRQKKGRKLSILCFGSLKVFAYIIKMHLIILPRVDIILLYFFLAHFSLSCE